MHGGALNTDIWRDSNNRSMEGLFITDTWMGSNNRNIEELLLLTTEA